MYLCLCNAISEREAERAVASGARKLAQVYAEVGGNVIGVEAVPDSETHKYGIVDPEARDGRRITMKGMVEKPAQGTAPSNLSISVMEAGRIEVIAGVNLPMLIKLASVRADTDLDAAVEQAQEAGRKYINVASRLLGK